MPSTVAHGIAGALLHDWWVKREDADRGARPTSALLWCLALANLPDLDLALDYLGVGGGARIHGGVTHTVPFCVAAALLFSPTRVFGGVRRTGVVAFVLLLSHIVLDSFTGKGLGLVDGWGVMWLYPLSAERFTFPFKVFVGAQHRHPADLFAMHNVLVVAWELFLFAPLVLWTLRRRLRRHERHERP